MVLSMCKCYILQSTDTFNVFCDSDLILKVITF